jgi:protein-disulfide isomerase
MSTSKKATSWLDLPKAILLAGLFIGIGLGIGLTAGKSPANAPQAPTEPQAPGMVELALELDADEHIKGNPDADIIAVEYSDYDCPFCSRVHPTLDQLVAESDIAWAYRHFPLESIHPEAFGKAQTAECIAQLAGNDAFWEFTDGILKNQSEEQLIAQIGVEANALEACKPGAAEKVRNDITRGQALGVRGTPFTILYHQPSGQAVALNGAQPKQVFEAAIEALRNL